MVLPARTASNRDVGDVEMEIRRRPETGHGWRWADWHLPVPACSLSSGALPSTVSGTKYC